jgi:sulfur carrier protein ThiS
MTVTVSQAEQRASQSEQRASQAEERAAKLAELLRSQGINQVPEFSLNYRSCRESSVVLRQINIVQWSKIKLNLIKIINVVSVIFTRCNRWGVLL